MTLADVAREAGVSLATASRVLNGSDRAVGDDLRDRVQAVAERLNYSPSAPAQAVARGRTNVVGLVVPDIADPYFSTIAAGVIRRAEPHGLMVTLSSTSQRPEREAEYVAALRHQRARGVILVGSRTTESEPEEALRTEIDAFDAAGGRVVAVSQNRLSCDTVVLENRAGARELATRLTELGYRRFAVLAGPQNLLTARDRLAGFRDGLRRAGIGLSAADVVHGEFTRDGGHEAAVELLRRERGAECAFAVNDIMAVGAMAACREHGLGVHDLAVAGFDDIATLRDITPGLSTVRIPLEKLGEAAFDMLVDADRRQRRLRRFSGQVVLRDSTPQRG
ncbi:LacI family DNA-binding transcriptional regulator [Salinifilum aidingensis]